MLEPSMQGAPSIDAIAQSHAHVLAQAPAVALASLYQTASHAAGLSMQNAVLQQQSMNQVSNAIVSQAVAMILAIGEK